MAGNDLFVANDGSNTIGEYDATTGAAINANFITGLNEPWGLVVEATRAVAKDFNGDGFADLVWENSVTGGHVTWLLKNGGYTPGISSAINLPTLPRTWRVVDH